MLAPRPKPTQKAMGAIWKDKGPSPSLMAQVWFPMGSLKSTFFHVDSQAQAQTEGYVSDLEKIRGQAQALWPRCGFQWVLANLPFCLLAPKPRPKQNVKGAKWKVKVPSPDPKGAKPFQAMPKSEPRGSRAHPSQAPSQALREPSPAMPEPKPTHKEDLGNRGLETASGRACHILNIWGRILKICVVY